MSEQLIQEILATYRRHGWELQRALLRGESLKKLDSEAKQLMGDAKLIEADFDALWFARPSSRGREAWELRLVSETPYALFEAFEAEKSEADRDEVRKELEERMRQQASPPGVD